MTGSKSSEMWLAAGYELFAMEGPDGLQIERLARITSHNKSGFYHYFGNLDIYCEQLILRHYRYFNFFLNDVMTCNNVDPEYLLVLLKHKVTVMGQLQMVRCKSHQLFSGAHKEPDEKVVQVGQKIWANHIDIHDNPDLVAQYHSIIRDMFYSRISFENFNYDFLHHLANEAREVVMKIHRKQDTVSKLG